ncbi:glycoside hydrolase family 28 protein [Chitinophaga niabensis]|uniref:Polygalacturonase n=1 Tax=Chitinophaga niabensis TaxID=536979 RepID=A0A1N6DJX2_9BACT|nr:glycosyl hydrolase family 28 protein [Chitinophaga niabensis]SIN71129.1 Polygalacturonase [Chitinophaga niabensis]
MRSFIVLLLTLTCMQVSAKDYNASLFGIYSDGVTLNTRAIQYGIDYINKNGGGRLVFHVGRYLTGSIYLKSNVTIQLQEGAVLLGSLNPWDYDRKSFTALVFAYDQENVGITGKGIIDGQGRQVARNVVDNIHKGILKDGFRYDRPEAESRPMIINFHKTNNILIKGITIKNSSSWVQTYEQCKNLHLDSIFVDSKAYWNNDGIDIVDCEDVKITNSYIDSDDDGVCLKSHDGTKACKNVLIQNCVIRSSANGIKFGTASHGGFSHIRIKNIKVFDTYRSAVALQAVDGGFLEDVEVDSLEAFNTGNAIFLRIGERVAGRKGRLENIRISNLYAEIPATKPDVGYEYEGPTEDMPRNISPSSIVGMPDALINNVSFKNVTISYPGGANPFFAKVALDTLDRINNKATAYPEFSMFGELPAWGLFIRHAKNIDISGLTLTVAKKDFRTAVVFDNVQNAKFTNLTVKEPEKKAISYAKRSTGITINNQPVK